MFDCKPYELETNINNYILLDIIWYIFLFKKIYKFRIFLQNSYHNSHMFSLKTKQRKTYKTFITLTMSEAPRQYKSWTNNTTHFLCQPWPDLPTRYVCHLVSTFIWLPTPKSKRPNPSFSIYIPPLPFLLLNLPYSGDYFNPSSFLTYDQGTNFVSVYLMFVYAKSHHLPCLRSPIFTLGFIRSHNQ